MRTEYQIKNEIDALIVKFFGGDVFKAAHWMKKPNPLLGYTTPHAMIEAGRAEKLLNWIKDQLEGNVP